MRKLFNGFGGYEMRNLVGITLAGSLILASFSVLAQDEEAAVEYGWEGAGEFGFVNTTGNTDSTALNAKLEFIKTTESWRHRFTGTALMTDENGIKDNERYTVEAQSDLKLSEKSYVLGSFRWDADKFGPYDPQASATIGYGRELMKSEKHTLKAELGAGYRKLEERESGHSSSEAIIRFVADDAWQVFKSTSWTNRLLIEAGSDNTFTQFNTAATVSMTTKFALKVGFEVRTNSKLPPGESENTDTVTTVNLVYNF
jgi:putative salt-induced outer membrane protein